MRIKVLSIVILFIAGHQPAHGDFFISSYIPLFEFQFNGDYSPYDRDLRSSSFPFIPESNLISIECEEILKQADKVKKYSAQNRAAVAEADAALTANDRDAFQAARLNAAAWLQRMKAADGFLELVKSRPIKAAVVLESTDQIEKFLIDASFSGGDDSSWLNAVELIELRSALPVSVLRPIMLDGNLRNNFKRVTVSIERMYTPGLGAWSASVGRKDIYPIKLTMGWADCLGRIDPFWASYKSCVRKAYTIELNLSQGEFCSSLQSSDGFLLSFEVRYPGELFGDHKLIVKYLVGQHPVALSDDESLRKEGRNRALDYLFGRFILDVFDSSQQIYRVDDGLLADLDGGVFSEGKVVQARDLNGNVVVIQSRSLRDALNVMNDKLSRDGRAVSFAEVDEALHREDRYQGLQIELGGKSEQAVVFKFETRDSRVEIGFILDKSQSQLKARVVFVIADAMVLYYHPDFFRCQPGAFPSQSCW